MSPTRLSAALSLLVLAVGAASTTAAEPGGHTTVQQRVRGGDTDAGFQFLGTRPGEPHMLRQERLGTAVPGRLQRRRSLLYFAQLSDFQLADEESPARVEFVDVTANPPFPTVFSAAQRPQEALVPQAAEAGIRQINRFGTSPVRGAGGRRARLSFSVFTGDLADSQQFNETRAVRTLLEGGTLDPNSGVGNAGCPPGTPGADEARRYTGVQDRNDFAEGPQFYDPNAPQGPYAAWPRWPGLMDRAQAPFSAQGLRVPSYIAFGNHDGLVQGNAAATAGYESVGTGCVKPTAPAFNALDPQSALNPTYLGGLVTTNPGAVGLVPRDPDRRYLDHAEFKRLMSTGRSNDHGFGFVDRSENAAGAGRIGYYSWRPRKGFRFISVDTVSEAGVPGPSAEGNIDDPQFRWLRRTLRAAERADELVVVFGHHPIRSLNSPLADEQAPPCGGNDAHGHGTNPGCDKDPRNSEPIHRGDDLRRLLLANPHVIATVFGHTHENKITPFARRGGGGFWGIESPSHIDWPIQSRLLEVMDNADGTLSIFGTVLDVDAPVRAPASGTNASGFGVPQLASVARTIAFNDPQAGGNPDGNRLGDGLRADRNVELVLRDPRRSTGGAGRCARALGRVRGKKVGSAALGRKRGANRRRYRRSARLRSPRRNMDRFCLVGRRNIRIGYPRGRYRRKMSARDRRRTRGRAVIAMTSHPRYSIKGVRNGTRIRTMRRRFRGERSYRVGSNRWYLVRAGRARIAFKTKRGLVRGVGLVDKRLTRSRKRARRLLTAFPL